jgi:Cell Wall Hydrolase
LSTNCNSLLPPRGQAGDGAVILKGFLCAGGLAASAFATAAAAQLTPAIPETAVALPAEPSPTPPTPPAGEDRNRAVQCLTAAIAYEAGFEPTAGQEAVAEVILNRARSGPFPRSVCGVVFAGSERRTGCQFTFTCDGSLRRRLPARVMAAARGVAEAALDGRNPLRVSGAAWYHADYVSPYWAPSLVRVAKIGAHIFYRAPGLGDRTIAARSFTASGEPAIAALAVLGRLPDAATTVSAAAAPARAPAAAPAPAFSLWGLAPKR